MVRRQQYAHTIPSPSTPLEPRPPWVDEVLGELAAIREVLSGHAKSHLTVDEFAETVGRSAFTVRRWISERRIVATRVQGTGPRGRLLVPRGELDRVVQDGLGEAIPSTAISSHVPSE